VLAAAVLTVAYVSFYDGGSAIGYGRFGQPVRVFSGASVVSDACRSLDPGRTLATSRYRCDRFAGNAPPPPETGFSVR